MTTALLNLVLTCMAALTLATLVSAIQGIFNDRKRNQRLDAQEKRDQEYHEKRMKELS